MELIPIPGKAKSFVAIERVFKLLDMKYSHEVFWDRKILACIEVLTDQESY